MRHIFTKSFILFIEEIFSCMITFIEIRVRNRSLRSFSCKTFYSIISILLSGYVSCAQVCPIIPKPLRTIKSVGFFELGENTQLIGHNRTSAYVPFFKKYIKDQLNINLSSAHKAANKIELIIEETVDKKGAYQLLITKAKILIKANDKEGLFNGLMSLSQLAELSSPVNGKLPIACWAINDAPLFAWRGFMLDEARHFFGVKKVKQILDWMAFYKLNRFHWHLTDVQGWRIEVKKYPDLATIGGIGNSSDSLKKAAYYTRDQIAEIVTYAAERNIMVFPEIDMPGHATAANRAYPEYNGGGSIEYPNFTFNPGKEKTYTYLTDIIKEILDLFPSKMIHLGGDEVSFGAKAWETNADVEQLRKDKNLENLKKVENYFFKRMADSVYKLNTKLLAWDEAVDANLPVQNTLFFWWRQDKPEQLQSALTKGYQVVLCPRLPLYFDFVQNSNHKLGRKWDTKFNVLEDVYNFPYDNQLFKNKLVVGIQANLWTETVMDEDRLDFMLFPRIAALAESAWTAKANKNLASFKSALQQHFQLYKKAGLNFYNPDTANSTMNNLDGPRSYGQGPSTRTSEFAVKGFHLDLRIQVMTMPALKDFALNLSKGGVNTLIMEWEATYPFRDQPMIPNRYAYTRDQINQFIAYCKGLHIDVIPLQQSFGHVEYILRNYKYAALREDQKDYSQVCPVEAALNKELFTNLYKDLISTHSSDYIHIGGDETYLLGHCDKCRKKIETRGKSGLYMDHIKMLCEIVVKLGKRPVLWADIAIKYPEEIHLLPKQTVFVDWNYGWDLNKFGDHQKLINSGYEIWGAPSIRSDPDNYFLTQWEKHFKNISSFIPLARKMGYKGIIMTSWSTSGVYSPEFETATDIIDLHAIRHVYPVSGFNLLIEAYLKSIGQAEPLDIQSFIRDYTKSRYGFDAAQASVFWRALTSTPFEISQGKPSTPKFSLNQVLDSAIAAAEVLNTMKPVANKNEFAHYRMMARIRAQYLRYATFEARANAPDFKEEMVPELILGLRALDTKSLDRVFARLNKNILQPGEIRTENELRNVKIKLLINRLTKTK